MAQIPPDLELHPLGGRSLPASNQLSLFQLLLVVLDPYTHQSSWLLETAGRILTHYTGADVRPAFLLTCGEDGAREFLGPWTERLMCFCDEDRSAVRALGISEVPALIHLASDGSIAGVANGWDPETWRPVLENLAVKMSWSRPAIPVTGDPVPFPGTAAVPA